MITMMIAATSNKVCRNCLLPHLQMSPVSPFFLTDSAERKTETD